MEVTEVTPVTYADGFPAFTSAVAYGGFTDGVQLDTQVLRGTMVSDPGVTLVQNVRPGQSVGSDAAVLVMLSSYAEYTGQYRVHEFESAGGRSVSDLEIAQVCS